ncbi:MAG: hypothetical protein P8J87_07365 [Verrucomicrobiales bacterium]|nr:hypothetical protein [Verrucomicrobiales bacterium]
MAARAEGDAEFWLLLEAERVRMGRSGNLLRILMGFLFLCLFVGQEFIWHDNGTSYSSESRAAVVWLFMGYIGAAVAVWRVGCLSEAWAARTFLAIPVVDVAMVYLRQRLTLGSYGTEELRHMTGYGSVILVCLIVLALTSLDWRFILVTGLVAAGSQSVWKAELGATLSEHLWSFLALGGVTGLVLVLRRRLLALVHRLVDERERRIRLNRFFPAGGRGARGRRRG